jgi:hypothetical protein
LRWQVNGTTVHALEHRDVVLMVKDAGDRVVLTVLPNPQGALAQRVVASDPILKSRATALAKTNQDRIEEVRAQPVAPEGT